MIEEKKLYPITYLRNLKIATREKLMSAGIILLKELNEKNPKELEKNTGISKENIVTMIKKARTILSEN